MNDCVRLCMCVCVFSEGFMQTNHNVANISTSTRFISWPVSWCVHLQCCSFVCMCVFDHNNHRAALKS